MIFRVTHGQIVADSKYFFFNIFRARPNNVWDHMGPCEVRVAGDQGLHQGIPYSRTTPCEINNAPRLS